MPQNWDREELNYLKARPTIDVQNKRNGPSTSQKNVV